MDEDDQGAAEAHQQELEAQERAEISKGRRLLAQSRRQAKVFESEMTELNERIETNWRDFHGDHGI